MEDINLILEFMSSNPDRNKEMIDYIKKNNSVNNNIINFLSKELIYLAMSSNGSNIKFIKAFLNQGANVDHLDIENKCTPIGVLCWKGGNILVAEELIKRGANVNFVCCDGFTPLMYAVNRADIALVQLLISYGANVHHINDLGESILDRSNKYNFYDNQKEKNNRIEVRQIIEAFI
jgi:ankyrin repeat protein